MLRSFEHNPLLLVVLILVVVVVFGAKRLPDAARSLGRSARIFKTEIKEMKDDGASSSTASTPSRPLEGRVVDDAATQRTTQQPGVDTAGQQHRGV